MKKFFLPVAVICCTLLFSCTNDTAKTEPAGSFNLDSAKAAIAANNASYGACFANGDSAAFVSHYTTDACINPSNMPKMCGLQAINGFFVGGYKMGIRNLKLTTDEIMGGAAAVVETGSYEVLGDKGVSFEAIGDSTRQ